MQATRIIIMISFFANVRPYLNSPLETFFCYLRFGHKDSNQTLYLIRTEHNQGFSPSEP